MFIKTNYYALVSSLPVLSSFDEPTQGVDLNWFLQGPFELLTESDKQIVKEWALFEINVMNIQRYSEGLEGEIHPLGWTKDLIENELSAEKPSVIPAFALQFLRKNVKKSESKKVIASDDLWQAAFTYTSDAPLDFLRSKFRFDYELRLILAAYRCKQKNLQPSDYLVPIEGDELADASHVVCILFAVQRKLCGVLDV